MPSNISFNPMLVTNGGGSFNVQSDGFVQGSAMDDPTVRNLLCGGPLAATETLPMWGGVAIFENIPLANLDGSLGNVVGRATSLTNLLGFSVLNQAHNWISSPQSEVPTAGANMTIPYYRLGSNARIPVACDPALIALDGGLTTQQVSWDFASQRLVAYAPSHGTLAISAASWSAGIASVTVATNTLVTGDTVNISGILPVGYNGDQVITVTDSTHFTFPLAVNPGSYVSGGQVDAGGGALPCRVLMINNGNSKTVVYDTVNNLVHWNPSGSCALIQI